MHTLFHNQQYSSASRTHDEQNARLATHIALFLRSAQQRTGQWQGSHLGNELRYTCHALEALHLLRFQAFHNIMDSGIHWLINLGEVVPEDTEEWSTVRLHPSKFKTLARLGVFSDDQTRAEFSEVCDRISEEGLLNGVMQDSLLGAMIVVDTVMELEKLKQCDSQWRDIADPVLTRVHAELAAWCSNPNERNRNRLVNDIDDASYALDVLLQSGRLTGSDRTVEIVQREMLSEVDLLETNTPLSKEIIYSAIQLGAHFGHDLKTRSCLNRFFHAIRVRYDRNQIQKDDRNADLQPLILRALLVFSGDELRELMIAQMLDSAFDSVNQSQILQESERNRQFELLVRKRTKISIRNVLELSGGITDARVFRITYAVNADGLGTADDYNPSRFQLHSVVVKCGSRANLQQSVERYQHLRGDVQPYFAQHSRQPEVLEASPLAPAYLILEDLTDDYLTLRQIFTEVDRHKLSSEDKRTIASVTEMLMLSLFDIYRRTRRKDTDLVGLQISRLYLSRLDRSLIEMCMPDKFPRLKELFRGFWLGDKRYDSIERYQSLLYRHRETLRPPCLMLMHGDCHGRNVMLDQCYEHMKLIDLDKLDYTGDYIMDIGLLIEDMALFRRLFDEGYHHYLRPEQIDFSQTGNRITYPYFVSEAAIVFQQMLLEHVEQFADELGDRHYKARLWLAIALYLLRLVEKAQQYKTAAVLYIEAVKLLHVLIEHLQTSKPLPTIPIQRESNVFYEGVGSPESSASLDSEIEAFNQLLLSCARELGLHLLPELRSEGRSIRYYRREDSEPYVMLDGKRRTPRILLRCPADSVADNRGYVEPIRSTGVFKSVLSVPAQYSQPTLRAILMKALSWLD